MYKFTCIRPNFFYETQTKSPFSTLELTVHNSGISLSELLEEIEGFLLACGFSLDGRLDIICEEEKTRNDFLNLTESGEQL